MAGASCARIQARTSSSETSRFQPTHTSAPGSASTISHASVLPCALPRCAAANSRPGWKCTGRRCPASSSLTSSPGSARSRQIGRGIRGDRVAHERAVLEPAEPARAVERRVDGAEPLLGHVVGLQLESAQRGDARAAGVEVAEYVRREHLRFHVTDRMVRYRHPVAPGPARILTADVCVYGGTSAGIAAAVAARRLGRTAVVAAFGRHLGGMSAAGLGMTDTGDTEMIGGLARELLRPRRRLPLRAARGRGSRSRRGSPSTASRSIATSTCWPFATTATGSPRSSWRAACASGPRTSSTRRTKATCSRRRARAGPRAARATTSTARR